MKMRKGAPLLIALVALLGAAQAASASHCGAVGYDSCSEGCSDAQSCFPACQQQSRVCYKLVYDTVMEKRWHTCYKTVCETVNKQVCKTCFKDECKTMYRECHVTKCKDGDRKRKCCRNRQPKTCWKEVQCTVNKPCVEHCVKDVECCIKRCCPKIVEQECHYTVCVPVYEQHCHTQCCQVQKQLCEQHCKEVCFTACHKVCEQHTREVCCQVSKCIEECHMKQVCVPGCKDVMETCYKNCTKRICEPCTTYKCVTKRVVECVEEPCASWGPGIGGGLLQRLFGGHSYGDTSCSSDAAAFQCCANGTRQFCQCLRFDALRFLQRLHVTRASILAPARRSKSWIACERHEPDGRLRLLRLMPDVQCLRFQQWLRFPLAAAVLATMRHRCNSCAPTTRKVWKVRCVTEQVPCTTYVTRCITEKVPVTVCKKVHYNEIRQVPYTVRRHVRGAYVDDKGVASECDGPGRHFQEGAVARKLIPYTVVKNVTTIEKKSIPYTVSRCARGAYVDDKGNTFGCDAPGRHFEECKSYNVANTYTTTKMVQEHRVKKVQYTVYETVIEKQIKKVPYQVCRMVTTTITKKVPYTECVVEKFNVCKKVPYTECVQQPYTVHCRVPYTVYETVPCTVTKQIKICVPEDVCIKKARMVPVTVSEAPRPCPAPACPTTSCCTSCTTGCCESSGCLLDRLRQRWFASLCSTGCCEQSCKTNCTSTCNDCHDFCREGLLQRLFRNRFACEPTCCEGGCSTGGVLGTVTTVPATPVENVPLPKALPKN